MNVFEIKKIIGDVKGTPIEKINLGMSLKDDLHISSFEMMIIIFKIEQMYDSKLKIDYFKNVVTVNDFYDAIKKHKF